MIPLRCTICYCQTIYFNPDSHFCIHILHSQNRLVVPSDDEIEDLQPSFGNLKEINLSSCGLHNWQDILHVAALWPSIESVSLQNNGLSELSRPNCEQIFKNLQSLDLHHNRLSRFEEILKLGNIRTLKRLYLMNNNLEAIQLPDCDPTDYVKEFSYLEELNLRDNPIRNESETFNELDKLERLAAVVQTPTNANGFEHMFARAVALISGLRRLNKIVIMPKMRRDSEIDVWKEFGMEYMQAQKGNEMDRHRFQRKCRAYSRLVKSKWNVVPCTYM